jgi:hypothetical protein
MVDKSQLPPPAQTGYVNVWQMDFSINGRIDGRLNAGGQELPPNLNTVVCVHETFVPTGTYTGGPVAVRIDFDARIVDWHSGAVLASQQFRGGDPPQSTYVPNDWTDVEGDNPYDAVAGWINSVVTP